MITSTRVAGEVASNHHFYQLVIQLISVLASFPGSHVGSLGMSDLVALCLILYSGKIWQGI